MKVVVVGAGLAGLVAATDLTAAGVDTVVLEARDQVGGRTHGIEVGKSIWADAGAAYLGDRHTDLHALLARLGIKTVPTAVTGASRFALARDDRVETRRGRFPPLDAVALGELFDLLETLAATVPPAAPWRTPAAARWDSLTAAEWSRRCLRHDARVFLPLFLGELMAADPAAVSMLHVAFYLCSGGGLRYLNAFEAGAQQDRIDGGAHQVSHRLAAGLGERVRLRAPVVAVHQDRDGVTVHTAGAGFRADAAVVAVPPLLADAIEYRPGPPVARAGPRTRPGCAVKVHLVYDAPWWRDHGLSGWSLSANGPLLSTIDDSPPDGGAGILTGFITGAEARRYASWSAPAQQEAALAHAARLFPELPAPAACHVTDWVTAAYSRGCYAALFGPGDWVRLGPQLTAPHHRVHWAGTETSTEYFGLMEGAIRSGHRAAREILSHYQPSGRSR